MMKLRTFFEKIPPPPPIILCNYPQENKIEGYYGNLTKTSSLNIIHNKFKLYCGSKGKQLNEILRGAPRGTTKC